MRENITPRVEWQAALACEATLMDVHDIDLRVDRSNGAAMVCAHARASVQGTSFEQEKRAAR
eukprot:IDg1481t1